MTRCQDQAQSRVLAFGLAAAVALPVAPHAGPALQAGADVGLSRTTFLNFDLRWKP